MIRSGRRREAVGPGSIVLWLRKRGKRKRKKEQKLNLNTSKNWQNESPVLAASLLSFLISAGVSACMKRSA